MYYIYKDPSMGGGTCYSIITFDEIMDAYVDRHPSLSSNDIIYLGNKIIEDFVVVNFASVITKEEYETLKTLSEQLILRG